MPKSPKSVPSKALAKAERARPKHHITLEEAISDLRQQITELPHDDPFFKIKGVEIELAVTTEKTKGGKVGVSWVVAAGGEVSSKTGTHHRIRIQLELIEPGRGVGSVEVAAPDDYSGGFGTTRRPR